MVIMFWIFGIGQTFSKKRKVEEKNGNKYATDILTSSFCESKLIKEITVLPKIKNAVKRKKT